MKLLKKNINEKDGMGSIVLRCEEPEDMWHVYNLIHHGDSVRTTTFRKVVKEGATGSTKSQRVRLNLTIEVEDVHFDPVLCMLRIRGKNTEESQHVKLGAYHTLDLELNRDFTLIKQMWDVISLERVDLACSLEQSADIAAIVMQPGLAHLCLIKGHMTVIKAKIEVSVPRKRTGSTAHEKSMTKFYDQMIEAIRRHVNFDLIKCVLLASPGFLKDDFYKYMMKVLVEKNANTEERKRYSQELKQKCLTLHASSGHKHALDEILANKKVQSQVVSAKAAEDVAVLNVFMDMMHHNQDQAYYGYKHVVMANEQMAVETLLITDELFRNNDVPTRKKYVKLVEDVRDNGGKVHVFSSLHVSGEQLGQISGIAAILRFPLPDLELDSESDESDNEEEELKKKKEIEMEDFESLNI